MIEEHVKRVFIYNSDSVRNLGVIFDKNLLIEQQIREVCKKIELIF